MLGSIYELRIYELPDDITDPNIGVLSGLLPVFSTQTASTSYFYGPGDPLLIPGRRYAIVVQAQDIGGGDAYDNQGLSQVVAFTISGSEDPSTLATCPAPTGLNVRQEDLQTLEVSWDPVSEANDYILQFRKANQPWQSQISIDNGLMLVQLSPAIYEVQVATRCASGKLSAISPIVSYEIISDTPDEPVEDPLTYYNEDPEPQEPTKYEEPEPEADLDLFTTPYTIITDTENLPEVIKNQLPPDLSLATLGPAPSTDELKNAVKSLKTTCAAVVAGYTCGNHDAAAIPDGADYQPKPGDELAINSIKIEVVEIDAGGNGLGIAHIKGFNNAKLGVELRGIKVKLGGCIYAGKAELNSVDIAILNDKQRDQLAKAYAVFQKATDVAIENAGAIAEVYNDIAAVLKAVKTKAQAVINKQNNNEKQSKKDLQTLQILAEKGIDAKKKELEILKKKPGADTSKYVNDLTKWLTDVENCKPCLKELIAEANTAPPKSKGPSNFDDYNFVGCSIEALTVDVPEYNTNTVIAPLIAYALKKMAEAGTGALLDGIVQYSVYKYSEGLSWEAAWDKIEFDKSSMFFSGISSMVKNKALSVGIDAVGSVVSYVVETPAENITMNQVIIELGKGAGMGLISNFGGDAVRAVSNKIGADKVTEGFIRLCKDLKIGKETSEKVAKVLDGIVDKKKFDDIWERVFGKVVKLLVGEGKVGSYKSLLGEVSDNLTPHHVASWNYLKKLGLPDSEYRNAICINMEMPKTGGRHRLTKTYGRNMTDIEKVAYNKLSPLEALEFDINDLRKIYSEANLYDDSLEALFQNIITLNKSTFPNIFK